MATYEDNILEGTVSFEDGTKSAEEYAPARKVRVELKFDCKTDEIGSEVLAFVGDTARAEVARLLGGKAPALTVVGGTDAPAGEASAGEPAKRTRRTKAQIEADAAAAAAAKSGGGAGGVQTSEVDPSAITDDDVTLSGPKPDASAVEDNPDEWELPGEDDAKFEEVTDADLNSAVQKKNAELADPPRIRELIGSYNPDPKSVFQLRQIPQEKRAEFLAKLAVLKKAA